MSVPRRGAACWRWPRPAAWGKPLRRLWLSALVLAGGCAALPPPAPFAPLPPESFGGSARASQIISYNHGERSSTVQGYIEVTPQKITLVGATALGQRVLSLSYDEQGLRAETLPAEGAPPAEQVLADLQLAVWPLSALQLAVAGSDWRIAEPRPGTRRVWRGGELYAEIHYANETPWEGRVWLVNFRHAYSVDIESRALP